MTYRSRTEDETLELGRRLARELPRQCVVLLIGNLGAGKTTLAKGFLEGLGVATPEEVTSPTFTLIHEYNREHSGDPGGQGSALAYHIDLYRLDTAREVAALGLDELFDRSAVVLIEWGERFPELLPRERIEIRISADADETRTITVESTAS